MTPAAFHTYRRTLQANLRYDATEHTHRPALQALLESAGGIVAVNEPRRIACGAPDFVIAAAGASPRPIGYIETKDAGDNLTRTERSDQLRRYRAALPNLILTNYTDFRWYINGDLHAAASLDAPDGAASVGLLLDDFLRRTPQPVASAPELARRMAHLTRLLRDVVTAAFANNTASPNVRDLHRACRDALVPDLTPDDFADMFAQTLAYGLFAARVSHPAGDFRRRDAPHLIPAANPFIRQLFYTVAGPDLDDEPFVSFVDDLTQLLADADPDALFADFGSGGVRQDPVMHFYESFLAAYNPALRERRGVYYTPEPVISYIVRSVDRLLKERFHCPDGLADRAAAAYPSLDDSGNPAERTAHRVLVLDPACGTGSFLYAVVDHIRQHYKDAGNAGLWRGYVKDHLLPRLFGFELLMAPYAMAHLKLGLQLAAQDLPAPEQPAWAYRFDGAQRLGVYLTNALEQSPLQQPPMLGPLRAITDEANAAAQIKRELPIMVVLGNPPYSGHSANKGEWIGSLVNDYKTVDGKPLGERNPKWLQDDYVKFIRFGQWRIQQSGAGILAFITNHAYLNNPTFRGMRQQLLDTFTDIYLLDLHGNSRTREVSPDGSLDENVFDIQQGVAVAIFVKDPDKSGPAKVNHADLYGIRDDKYRTLSESDLSTTAWQVIQPETPDYRFKPWDKELEGEYREWPAITEIMHRNSAGIITARDRLTIRWSSDEVMAVVKDFASLPPETARTKYNLGKDAQDWKVIAAQADLNDAEVSINFVSRIQYRPLDMRYTYYTGKARGFMTRTRHETTRHFRDGSNIGLLTTRQMDTPGDFDRIFVTDTIVDGHAVSLKEITYQYPLYLYPTEQQIAAGLYPADHREPNLSPAFIADLEQRTGLQFLPDGAPDLPTAFGPEDVFHYIYALFHSPAYRQRYDQFLRADFPRVPLPPPLPAEAVVIRPNLGNDARAVAPAGTAPAGTAPAGASLFRALSALGRRLVDTHLLRPSALDTTPITFPIPGDNTIARGYPKYTADHPGGNAPGTDATGADTPGAAATGANTPGAGRPGNNGAAGRVHINPNQYFAGVAPEVWQFRIGGYQPMDKWLKDRRSRTLTFDDLEHYRRIAAALAATIRLMPAVDAALADHGGLFG